MLVLLWHTRSEPAAWRRLCWLSLYAGLLLAVLRQLPRGRRRLLLPLLAVHLLLVLPESALRAAGFRYQSGIEFGYPRPVAFRSFEPHPELFWRFPPGRPGVNSWGFETHEVPAEKRGRWIVALGDSVTYQGYPRSLESLLTSESPRRPVTVFNFGVPGYSSHQGLVIARRHARELRAELAIIAFGWNDHWLAWGAEDHRKTMPPPATGLVRRWQALEHRLRLLQAVRSLAGRLAKTPPGPLTSHRVPPARFRANLTAIIEQFAAAGTSSLLVTLPSLHAEAGVPDYLVERRFVADAESALRQHEHYNAIVREVAATTRVGLVDLATRAAGMPGQEALFLDDGIHLSDRGVLLMALEVAAAVREPG